MHKLIYLDVSFNNITKVDDLFKLTKLTKLKINNNNIKDLISL